MHRGNATCPMPASLLASPVPHAAVLEALERFFLLYVQAGANLFCACLQVLPFCLCIVTPRQVSPCFKRTFAKTFIRQYDQILQVPGRARGSE